MHERSSAESFSHEFEFGGRIFGMVTRFSIFASMCLAQGEVFEWDADGEAMTLGEFRINSQAMTPRVHVFGEGDRNRVSLLTLYG